MATAGLVSLNVSKFGSPTAVPNDDLARLMYYLRCVTVSLGFDFDADLVDYKNYLRLSIARRDVLLASAFVLNPTELIDKLIFLDLDGTVTRKSSNEFINISVACSMVSVQREIVVAGKTREVNKVMFCKPEWLDYYYYKPMKNKSMHCAHCLGSRAMCSCDSCPRKSGSACKTFVDILTDTLIGTSISSAPPPYTPTMTNSKAHAGVQCDGPGCRAFEFEGARFKCRDCDDYDLCRKCYTDNKHSLTHRFTRYDLPDSKPVHLPPRYTPPPPAPARTPAKPAPAPSPPPARTQARARAPAPAPAARSSGPLTPSHFKNMSTSQLKQYLKENDVSITGILEKDALSRRAWETYCDCVEIAQLNKFLTDNNMWSADCQNISTRRQRAKGAFRVDQVPSPSSRPRRTAQVASFEKHDIVTLTGLNRAEMNGQTATVMDPNCGEGRAEVYVESLGKKFKVKFENLAEASGDADEYLD